MEKKSFMDDFERVMGTRLTLEDTIIGLLMVAGGLLVLQLGELIEQFLLSLG